MFGGRSQTQGRSISLPESTNLYNFVSSERKILFLLFYSIFLYTLQTIYDYYSFLSIILFIFLFIFYFFVFIFLHLTLPVAYTEQVKYAAGTRPFGQPLVLPSQPPDEDLQQPIDLQLQLGPRRSLMAGAVMAAKKNLTFKK